MLILVVIQTIVLALVLVLVVSLLKSHAAILRRLHAAGLGEPHSEPSGLEMEDGDLRTVEGVPGLRAERGPLVDIAGTSPRGSSVAVGIEDAKHPTLLAFLSSSCITCAAFWEAFRSDPLLPGGARLVVVTNGPDGESPSKVSELAPAGATTVMSDAAWNDYAVPGSPYFVLAGPGGQLLGEGSALAWPQVEELIERALGDAAHTRRESKGQGRSGRRRSRGWRGRESDTDEELLAAGITPGDPRLYQDPPVDDHEGARDGPH